MLEWIIYALLIFYVHINYLLFFVSSFFSKKIKPKKIKNYPKISVIIPTKNEANVIDETLKRVRKCDYPKNKLEIIIVDANSKDETIKIAKKYADKIIIEKKPNGKPHALNIGIKKASGDIIYFLDADNWIEKDTIKTLIQSMNGYNAAKGTTIIRNKKSVIEKVSNLEIGIHELLVSGFSKIFNSEIISGYNFMIKKNILRCVGYFHNSLTEDINISFRLYKRGERISIINAPCSILVPKNLHSYWKQQERWRMGGINELIKMLKIKNSMMDLFIKMPFLVLSTIVCSISIILFLFYLIFGGFILLSGAIIGFILIITSVIRFDKKELIYLPAIYLFYTILEIASFFNIFIKKLKNKKIVWQKTPK
ncbi:MAG: glycosyltransferase family 2 protein [Candidatus Aenigmatarchaeota archaeon]